MAIDKLLALRMGLGYEITTESQIGARKDTSKITATKDR
jgi:hypothetical protein